MFDVIIIVTSDRKCEYNMQLVAAVTYRLDSKADTRWWYSIWESWSGRGGGYLRSLWGLSQDENKQWTSCWGLSQRAPVPLLYRTVEERWAGLRTSHQACSSLFSPGDSSKRYTIRNCKCRNQNED